MNKTILDGLLNSKEYPFFKSMINNVVQGDTIAKMKELPDNSVDLLLNIDRRKHWILIR